MAETLEQYKKRIASSGGRAVVERRGKGHMKKISKKGLAKRWGKRSKIKELLF